MGIVIKAMERCGILTLFLFFPALVSALPADLVILGTHPYADLGRSMDVADDGRIYALQLGLFVTGSDEVTSFDSSTGSVVARYFPISPWDVRKWGMETVTLSNGEVVISDYEAGVGLQWKGSVEFFDAQGGLLNYFEGSIGRGLGTDLATVGDVTGDGVPDVYITSLSGTIYRGSSVDTQLTAVFTEVGNFAPDRKLEAVDIGGVKYLITLWQRGLKAYRILPGGGLVEVANIDYTRNGTIPGVRLENFSLTEVTPLGARFAVLTGVSGSFIESFHSIELQPTGGGIATFVEHLTVNGRAPSAGALAGISYDNVVEIWNYGRRFFAARTRNGASLASGDIEIFSQVSSNFVASFTEPDLNTPGNAFGDAYVIRPNPQESTQSVHFIGAPGFDVGTSTESRGAIVKYSPMEPLGDRFSLGAGCGVGGTGVVSTTTTTVTEGVPFTISAQGFMHSSSQAVLYLAQPAAPLTLPCGELRFDISTLTAVLPVSVTNGRVNLPGIVLPVGSAQPVAAPICYLIAAPEPTAVAMAFSQLECVAANGAAWGM